MKNIARAIFVIAAGLFAVALIYGLLNEQVQRARDRRRFPQVGRSVDIGGRMLNIQCAGSGQPAVILESGATWPLYKPKEMFENGAPRPGYSWVAIQRELAKLTTACWYDRAGSGWSDLGPYPRDSASQARDLHALLEAARVPPPYLLVAESSAALDARVYTNLYPADIAGLVFIDAVDPAFLTSTLHRASKFPVLVGRSQDAAAQLFNQVGLFRAGSTNRQPPAAPKDFTASEWNTIWHLTRATKARSALLQDIASWQQSASEATAAGNLGDRPFIVLSSHNTAVAPEYETAWRQTQTDLIRLSTRGKLVHIGESDGDAIYQARAAIGDAVREVVSELRRR
jgi:pimeloyl-ACP methyl ester carboxylesterase